MITLPGAIPLKIIDSPSSSFHLLSITSQLKEGFHETHLPPCCNVDWLNLVLVSYRQPQTLWIALCPEDTVLSLTSNTCNFSDLFPWSSLNLRRRNVIHISPFHLCLFSILWSVVSFYINHSSAHKEISLLWSKGWIDEIYWVETDEFSR